MTSRDFCYWLQGYFEITAQEGGLTPPQVAMVRRHLALVFKHEIDPSYGGDAKELRAIHDGAALTKPLPKEGRNEPFTSDTLIRC